MVITVNGRVLEFFPGITPIIGSDSIERNKFFDVLSERLIELEISHFKNDKCTSDPVELEEELKYFLSQIDDAAEAFVLLDCSKWHISPDIVSQILENVLVPLLTSSDRSMYTLVITNSYEIAKGRTCLDVVHYSYFMVENYDDFSDFIKDSNMWVTKMNKTLPDTIMDRLNRLYKELDFLLNSAPDDEECPDGFNEVYDEIANLKNALKNTGMFS